MANKKFLHRRPSDQPAEPPKPEPPKKKTKSTPPRPVMKNEFDADALLAELEGFEMDAVLALSKTKRRKVGDIVEGIVQDIVGDIALVNIGEKSEATIVADPSFTIGQELKATIVRIDHRGTVLAQKIEQGNDMEAYEVALDKQLPIRGVVLEQNSGGYVIGFGTIRGFCPLSQISLRRSTENHLQQEYEFVITEIKGRELIVSRRSLLEKQRKEQEASVLASLQKGKKYKGTVQNNTDFGLFVSIKGIDGLLPKTELKNVETQFDIGQEIDVVIHNIDGKRISLRLPNSGKRAVPELSDEGPSPTFGSAFSSILDDFIKK